MADIPEPLDRDLTRRRFLQGSAMAGVATFLAACTGRTGASTAPSGAASSGAGASANASVAPVPSAEATPKVVSGPLKFANWPAYIDLGDADAYSAGASPSLEEFKKEFKVEVDYQEKIGDNATFIETIKPALVGKLATGWDLIVLTDWMAFKIVANGWAEPIDQANVPNCVANVRDALKGSSWDADMAYH